MIVTDARMQSVGISTLHGVVVPGHSSSTWQLCQTTRLSWYYLKASITPPAIDRVRTWLWNTYVCNCALFRNNRNNWSHIGFSCPGVSTCVTVLYSEIIEVISDFHVQVLVLNVENEMGRCVYYDQLFHTHYTFVAVYYVWIHRPQVLWCGFTFPLLASVQPRHDAW